MKKRDGEMKQLSSLFSIYKDRLIAPQRSVIEATIEVIHDLTHISLDPKKASYTVSTKTFSSNAPALIRQELKKQEMLIIEHVKGRLGEKNAPKRIV